MTTAHTCFLTVLALSCALAGTTATADPVRSFRPALMDASPDSFKARIECPERGTRDAPTVVYCQSEISESGKPGKNAHCFSTQRRRRTYVRAAVDALDSSTFVPAAIDAESVPVYLTFGLAYVAPQEIVAEQTWYWRSGRLGHNPVGVAGPTQDGIMFVMSAAVSEHGAASDVRVDRNNFARRGELTAAQRGLSGARFIPGFLDGKPHAMRYYELLYVY